MKANCKINMKELVNVVDGMLAEKNGHGRQAFNAMTEDHLDNPGGQNMLEKHADHIVDIINRNGVGEDAKGQLMTFLDEILDEEKANAQGGLKEWSNPNFDGEGAFETLYDDIEEVTSNYEEIGQHGDGSPESMMRVKAMMSVAKELRAVLTKVEQQFGV